VSSRSAKKKGRTGLTRVTRTTVTRAATPRKFPTRGTASMGFLSIERKFYDNGLTATALQRQRMQQGENSTLSNNDDDNTSPRGWTFYRDGKEIAMLYLQINGTIALPSKEIQADAPNGCSVFVAIVLDTQTNAAQMNSEDCFQKYCRVGRSSGCTHKNLLFGKRFRILKERLFNMDVKTLSHFADDSFHGQDRENTSNGLYH